MTNNSKVLALKYRPQIPEDLIGQEVVIETIVNGIKSEKTKEKIKHKKLMTTKNNCKNVNDNILVFNTFELLKFLYEK